MKCVIQIIAIILLSITNPVAAQKKQQPPAGRSGIAPEGRAKIANVIARGYIHNKEKDRSSVKNDAVNQNSIKGGGCIVNVGTSSDLENKKIGARYGTSHNDNVTVVRGSVISVCK